MGIVRWRDKYITGEQKGRLQDIKQINLNPRAIIYEQVYKQAYKQAQTRILYLLKDAGGGVSANMISYVVFLIRQHRIATSAPTFSVVTSSIHQLFGESINY